MKPIIKDTEKHYAKIHEYDRDAAGVVHRIRTMTDGDLVDLINAQDGDVKNVILNSFRLHYADAATAEKDREIKRLQYQIVQLNGELGAHKNANAHLAAELNAQQERYRNLEASETKTAAENVRLRAEAGRPSALNEIQDAVAGWGVPNTTAYGPAKPEEIVKAVKACHRVAADLIDAAVERNRLAGLIAKARSVLA